MAEYAAELERVIAAPRPLVWAVVSDTNRWDRAAGLAPAKYAWLKEGKRNLRFAKAKELGLDLEWIEPPYQWIEGSLVDGLRRFRKGPLEAGGFRVTLEDAEGGATSATSGTTTTGVNVPAIAIGYNSTSLVGVAGTISQNGILDRITGGSIATAVSGVAGGAWLGRHAPQVEAQVGDAHADSCGRRVAREMRLQRVRDFGQRAPVGSSHKARRGGGATRSSRTHPPSPTAP